LGKVKVNGNFSSACLWPPSLSYKKYKFANIP
jgi:hypothetical protein